EKQERGFINMKSNKKAIAILITLLLCLASVGCQPATTSTQDPPLTSTIEPGSSVLQNALDVVGLLKSQDMSGLVAYIHPEKGARFTPYGNVDTVNNQLLLASQVSVLLSDTQTYLWGYYDGSGEPIQLSFSDYYDQFIYDVDFANPNLIGNNVLIGKGNTQINITEAYPDAVFVEFHFTGFDPQYDGIDWESLRLVFEEVDDIWYLSGIIHDQWTI
ncbi:MAG TPA: hypothetical protein VFD03_10990, partial [Clostridia bacterium]|nr:hypothetical protein [Clostridia bacterium]